MDVGEVVKIIYTPNLSIEEKTDIKQLNFELNTTSNNIIILYRDPAGQYFRKDIKLF